MGMGVVQELDGSTFRAFLDEMTDAATILDADDCYLYVNPAAARLMHCRADEVIGKPAGSIHPCRGTLVPSNDLSKPIIETHCSQTDRWYETSINHLSQGGTASVTRDVTDRKHAVELGDHLMGILGHEIRNPLAAIAMSISIFDGVELEREQRRSIERIRNCVRSLRRLTSDILDVARSRRGAALPIERRSANAGEICRDVIDELRYQDRTIELALTGDLDGYWDPERISQAIGNLLLNAIQYSDARSPIRVEVSGARERVRVDVINRGEPISRELLPRIFDPLRRDGGARGQSMGLGLYVVRLLVEAHQGEVSVESAPSGTRFRVLLPRGDVSEAMRMEDARPSGNA